ncbi:MAG: Bug family tripartite tricarboxylate transporter substrate binding protein [Thermodesulfobacteriota bacterium]
MRIGKDFFAHRNLLKIFILSAFVLALVEGSHIPLSFAKDVYPSGKITWFVPYKPGGGYDLLARASSPYLIKYLRELSPGAKGGDIIIRNEPGASGQRAYSMVYHARPDGYTIGGFDISFATETLMEKLDFDIEKFNFLLRVNTTSRIIVAHRTGFANWDEMLKMAKTREIKMGVGAFGRAQHIAAIIIKEKLKLPFRMITLGGTAESLNALIRGDVHVSLGSEDSMKPMIDAKEIRVIADLTGYGGYPNVPTSKDLGFPDLGETIEGHRFVIAPPGLPKDVGNQLVSGFKKAMNDPEFLAWLKKSDIPLNLVYGDEADRMAKRIFMFYQKDLKPILEKGLK